MRRFPSKQKLYEVTLTEAEARHRQLLEVTTSTDTTVGRRQLLDAFVAMATSDPGKSHLVIAAVEDPSQFPGAEELIRLTHAFAERLTRGIEDDVSYVRVVLAMQLVANAVLFNLDVMVAPAPRLSTTDYRQLISKLALAVLEESALRPAEGTAHRRAGK